jgi:hypothetical protein
MALTMTITNPRTIARIRHEAARRGLSPSETVEAAFTDDEPMAVRMDRDGAKMPRAETPEERAMRHAATWVIYAPM